MGSSTNCVGLINLDVLGFSFWLFRDLLLSGVVVKGSRVWTPKKFRVFGPFFLLIKCFNGNSRLKKNICVSLHQTSWRWGEKTHVRARRGLMWAIDPAPPARIVNYRGQTDLKCLINYLVCGGAGDLECGETAVWIICVLCGKVGSAIDSNKTNRNSRLLRLTRKVLNTCTTRTVIPNPNPRLSWGGYVTYRGRITDGWGFWGGSRGGME